MLFGISPCSTNQLTLNGTLSLTTDTSSGNVRTCVISPRSTNPLTLFGTWKLEHTHCLYWSPNSLKRRWTYDREWTTSQWGPGSVHCLDSTTTNGAGHPLWWWFVFADNRYYTQLVGHPQTRLVLIANQHCCHKAHSCSLIGASLTMLAKFHSCPCSVPQIKGWSIRCRLHVYQFAKSEI